MRIVSITTTMKGGGRKVIAHTTGNMYTPMTERVRITKRIADVFLQRPAVRIWDFQMIAMSL